MYNYNMLNLLDSNKLFTNINLQIIINLENNFIIVLNFNISNFQYFLNQNTFFIILFIIELTNIMFASKVD